jgi:hypothetical protein
MEVNMFIPIIILCVEMQCFPVTGPMKPTYDSCIKELQENGIRQVRANFPLLEIKNATCLEMPEDA